MAMESFTNTWSKGDKRGYSPFIKAPALKALCHIDRDAAICLGVTIVKPDDDKP